MHKQALIIGLGQFGMSLARALGERGFEILAVDRNESLVSHAAGFAAEAAAFDATDEEALARAAPGNRDVCVVAIGQEARDASILCTALLRQQGARRVVARATDALHERILLQVGADEVVNPERAIGERLAARLALRGVLEEVPLGDGMTITELRPPPVLVGRTLVDAALPSRFGVTVAAVRRPPDEGEGVDPPDPRRPLRGDDILVVVAPTGAVARMIEQLAG
jgi:trk system potassium uptake protein TrkA